MRCPFCQKTENRVIDSRTTREGRAVRRRRECLHCEQRFTTYEYVEERPLQVRKADGAGEPYERQKLLSSVRVACVKRPITLPQIEGLVAEVDEELHQLGRDEVESRAIGELVIQRLKQLDGVAYVRFASVYRAFQDIDEFQDELQELERRRAHDAASEGQVELPLPGEAV